MDHYGLHPAPYANGHYPMGLRETTIQGKKRVGTDCMLCHAGSIFGQSYLGLPNASLDMQALFDDMGYSPFTFSKVRGTTETSALAIEAVKIFNEHDIDDLIVVNARHEPVGLVDSQDLPKLKLM